jgi:hypothetical protein
MAALSKHKAEARRAYAASLAKPAPAHTRAISSMPIGQLCAALGFERSVPRCETCRFVKRPKTIIHKATNSLPVVLVPPICQRGKFYTRDTAICDYWTGHDGSTLAADTTPAQKG